MAKQTQTFHRKIGGLACSFCVKSINQGLQQLPGVEKANVSLAHEALFVQYDANQLSENEMIKTLNDLGYSVRDPDQTKAMVEQARELLLSLSISLLFKYFCVSV